MLTWSIVINVSYYCKKSCNNKEWLLWTDNCKPWTFWRFFSWYEVIFWSYSWSLWIVYLIFDNKGGKIIVFWAVYTIFYMIGPIVIDNLFLFLTWFAYLSTVNYNKKCDKPLQSNKNFSECMTLTLKFLKGLKILMATANSSCNGFLMASKLIKLYPKWHNMRKVNHNAHATHLSTKSLSVFATKRNNFAKN